MIPLRIAGYALLKISYVLGEEDAIQINDTGDKIDPAPIMFIPKSCSQKNNDDKIENRLKKYPSSLPDAPADIEIMNI